MGRCLPYGEGIGLWALGEIVKSHAGILDGDDQQTLRAKLEAVLTDPDPQMRTWMADRVSPLVGLQTSSEPPGQEEAFTAWRRFVEQIAADGPVVLVVEDLHWADDALVAFLAHLADHAAGLPLLLVATARPELEERHPAWLARGRRSTVLSLAALPDAAMTTLVGESLPGASPELLATVLGRAAGSPLYAEQLTAMIRDRESPVAGDALDDDTIPASIAALLAARIDGLPPGAREVLLDASVIDRTFWSGIVAALEERERSEVEPHLAELARREFIRPVFPTTVAGEAEFTFWHVLLRDVAYSQLTRRARLARHRAAAAWIAGRTGSVPGEEAEIVVAHLDRALELATATGATGEVPEIQAGLLDALIAAADTAVRTDVSRGVALLRRALELLEPEHPRRPGVLARLGRGLLDMEEYADAAVALEDARGLLLAAGRDVEAAILVAPLSRTHLMRGDAAAGDHIFAEAEEVLRRRGGAEFAGYLADAAQRAWTRLRVDDALRLADEALSLAQELGVAPPYRALNARGAALFDRGDRLGGERDVREAIRLASAAGDTAATVIALDNLANLLAWFSIPDALAATEEQLAFGRAHGLPLSAGELSRAGMNWSLGHWDEAVQAAATLERKGDERGNAYIQLFATTLRIGVGLERGEFEGDPAALAAEARTFGRTYAVAARFPFAARLALAQGRQTLAIALLEELADALEPGQLAGRDAVSAAVEAGRLDLARRLRDLGSQMTRRTGLPDAIVAEAEKNHLAAIRWYEQAVGVAREVGEVNDEAFALAGLGRCLLEVGRAEAGVARLREALTIWERLKATPRTVEIGALLATAE